MNITFFEILAFSIGFLACVVYRSILDHFEEAPSALQFRWVFVTGSGIFLLFIVYGSLLSVPGVFLGVFLGVPFNYLKELIAPEETTLQ